MKETSVLINTHNHVGFIAGCIDSVLRQTVRPDEIIVYDDGSTDGARTILRDYAARGDIVLIEGAFIRRAAYLNQAHAIAEAFGRCQGKLVFLLDGDDTFDPTKVERYLAAFTRNPDASLIQAPMQLVDDDDRVFGTNYQATKHISHHLTQIYRRQDVDFYYPTSALAFSRFYLERVLPVDFSDRLDLWIDTRLCAIAPYFGRVITLDEPLTRWRRHRGSDSLRARVRDLQIRQTRMRTHVFNRFCRTHHLRTISRWRNPRYYLQLARFWLPESCYSFYYQHGRRLMRRANRRPSVA